MSSESPSPNRLRAPEAFSGARADLLQTLSARLGSLCAELETVGGEEAALRETLRALKSWLDAETATVAFCGHFSSGKSTLLNALLRRSLLPTSDAPETGVVYILRGGERDEAVVCRKMGAGEQKRAIAVDTESLRNVTSLYDDLGERSAGIESLRRVEITLRDFPVPDRSAVWLDTPGINDDPEMQTRAYHATRQADIILWLLDTRRMLTLAEQEFIRRLTEERDDAGIVVLINAFLDRDTPHSWKTFVAERLNTQRLKIEKSAGMKLRSPVEMLLTSARALADAPSQYGGAELDALLAACARPGQPRVLHSRLGRAAHQLRELADEWTARHEGEAAGRAAAQEKVKQALAALTALRREIGRAHV